MTRAELRERLKRDLGYPYVKVELTNDHLDDAIDDALEKWEEWAIGNAVKEYYFTMPLSAGQHEYVLPEYVTDVLGYKTDTWSTGINTLFTIENFLYTQGYIDPQNFMGGGGLIGYQIAMDYIETLERYMPEKYTFKYARKSRKLHVSPTPELKEIRTQNGEDFNFAGFLLIRCMAYDGSFVDGWTYTDFENDSFEEGWIKKYALAKAKITLGGIRRKFAQFNSVGNTGISLDGPELVSEGKEEMDKLIEELDTNYAYEGYGISLGMI